MSEVTQQATTTVIRWLKSPAGQAALKEVERTCPVASSYHATHIGFAIGRYGQSISDATSDRADIDQIEMAIFGETTKEQVLRRRQSEIASNTSAAKRAASAANGKLGGRPRKAKDDSQTD